MRGIRANTPVRPRCVSPLPELVSPHTADNPEVPRTLTSIVDSRLAGRTDGPRDPGYITVLLCSRYMVHCRCVQKLPILQALWSSPALKAFSCSMSPPRSLCCRAVCVPNTVRRFLLLTILTTSLPATAIL